MATTNTFFEVSGENLLDLRNTAYQINQIEYLDTLNYRRFFNKYLVPNCPCIFSPELTKRWQSRLEWVDQNGSPNFGFLKRSFGTAVVPVANCKQEQYSSHPKQDWTLTDYLAYWQRYRDQGYPPDQDCLYMKDWHFTKVFPEYKAYETPVFFQSDWLNEYWDTLPQDDYRFVYMGPKGTWTPFHSDVYRSFSWSANICGRKKWIFYPPGCEECLKDCYGHLVYDVTSPDLADPGKYPRAADVKDKAIEVIQEQGEVIFVPSGWHHQVVNLEDTISINHNWLNSCNIDISWQHLVSSLGEVKAEIADCRDMDGWHDQCQLILKASAGIDFQMFIEMLEVIAAKRISMWQQHRCTCSCDTNADVKPEDKERQTVAETGIDMSTDSATSSMKCSSCVKSDHPVKIPDNLVEKPDSLLVKSDRTEKTDSDVKCESSSENHTSENVNIHSETWPLHDFVYPNTDLTCDCTDSMSKLLNEDPKTGLTCNLDSSEAKLRRDNRENVLLSSEDFIFYDLRRIQEVLQEMLGNEDLGKLSTDYKVRVRRINNLIEGCWKIQTTVKHLNIRIDKLMQTV